MCMYVFMCHSSNEWVFKLVKVIDSHLVFPDMNESTMFFYPQEH